MGRLVTVGVYAFTAERFLAALKRADVGVPFDVRQRRGVRGSEYAWANSQRLQRALADCDIGYRHLKELWRPHLRSVRRSTPLMKLSESGSARERNSATASSVPTSNRFSNPPT